ncbi:myogenesis-regulating glycosidase-like isoform X1 [Schistocerca cancellata]|uniref:myogenesis-regulating glycosidase-like isoform X1 n=1 Tax=Schistocerca cancellata TaxID=274614 RepID=UPI002117A303|nr:myogenesis-regulating glycosidase-like isoform X1 [Schistocerca cancellata]
MDSKYEALPTVPSASVFHDNGSLFRHKNAGAVRKQKLLKWIGILFIVLTVFGCAFYRIVAETKHSSNLLQQNVFHLLSTRNSAKIYMWDVSGANVTLLLQNQVTFSEDVGNPVSCDNSSFDLCLKWEKEGSKLPNAKLTLRQFQISEGVECHKLNVSAAWNADITSCVSITGEHLYGGPVLKQSQYWPSEKNEMQNVPRATGQGTINGVAESFWITSGGKVFYVPRDVPLFISQDSRQLCFRSKLASPYLRDTETTVNMKLYYCQSNDAQKLHRATVKRFLGLPSGIPDKEMIQNPVWSTWARYKREINATVVTDFAAQIAEYGFNRSHLEVDDRWESCYGDFKFNEGFPDPGQFIQDLNNKGFRVTLWAHPFVSTVCSAYSEAKSRNYLVKNLDQSWDRTVWWNGIAGLVDFTNRNATSWWNGKLTALRDNYGIDGFKFDAGETSYMPGSPEVGHLQSPIRLQPNIFTSQYVENAASLSRNELMTEFRVMYMNQGLPVFLRMSDKESTWGYENGLKSLIPTLLSLNIVGYSFVLPDMIGGNGYSTKPSKELFIRWLQASTFMPSLQFSYTPWDYDDETVEIAKKFTSLHAEYGNMIIDLAEQKVTNGTPINLPIWWLNPADATALGIDSEYLLGENLLVAPILEEGATSRDIYLPVGTWEQKVRSDATTVITGPAWIRGYRVELDELAYFVRVS